MSNEDKVPDPIAEFDQQLRGLREASKALWTFYAELLHQGFTTEQSLRLTMNWHKAVTMSQSDGEDA